MGCSQLTSASSLRKRLATSEGQVLLAAAVRWLLGGPRPEQGPVIGVVSRSRDRPIRTILDIENYDQELFYAGGPVIAGGFFTPYFSGSGQQAPSVNPCPNGGFMLPDNDGKMRCFGGLFDGQKPPKDRGNQ